MKDKALATIRKYALIEPNDTIVVGLSGGADSVALLCFLLEEKQTLQIGEIIACHVNHHIRGAEGDADEAFVQHLCEELGVRLYRFDADIPQQAREQKQSIELAAREARYVLFRRLAAQLSAKIATAHTASDSVETALLNFCRGSGIKGLAGIPPKRDGIIRPLIACTRAETEAFCAAHGQSFVTDSSNADDSYTRNKLRHRAVPVLREINPALPDTFVRMSELLQAENDYLERQAAQAYRCLFRDGTAERSAAAALDEVILRRVLKQLLEEHRILPQYKTIDLLCGLIRTGAGEVQLGKNLYVTVSADRVICGSKTESGAETPLLCVSVEPFAGPEERYLSVGRKTVRLQLTDYEQFQNFVKNDPNLLKNAIDYDKIKKNLVLRGKKPGDRLTLIGRNCTKTLKKLLNEDHVPQETRASFLLLADDGGPIWLERYGCHASYQVGSDTKRVLMLSVQEREM